jgi:hypothetical protein
MVTKSDGKAREVFKTLSSYSAKRRGTYEEPSLMKKNGEQLETHIRIDDFLRAEFE